MNLTTNQMIGTGLVMAVVFVIVIVFAQLAKSDDERYADDQERARRQETRRERLAHTQELKALAAYRSRGGDEGNKSFDRLRGAVRSARDCRPGFVRQADGRVVELAALAAAERDTRAGLRDLSRGVARAPLSGWAVQRLADPGLVEPAPEPEPRLVPLPQAGSREPDAVYAPGQPLPDEPLPEGEIAGWVAATLLQFAGDAENTFVRQLYTVPLGDVAGQFNRPLALTAGGTP